MSNLEKWRCLQRVEKVDSKWIPFGRHIMIAVKQNRWKEKQERLRERAQRHRKAGETKQTGRETPAVASPAVIIVLTFKWKALTIGAG